MLGGLKSLLFGNDAEEAVKAGQHGDSALHHAAAGLLIEAAMLDGDFHEAERERIETLLKDRFELPAEEVATLIAAAEEAAMSGCRGNKLTILNNLSRRRRSTETRFDRERGGGVRKANLRAGCPGRATSP